MVTRCVTRFHLEPASFPKLERKPKPANATRRPRKIQHTHQTEPELEKLTSGKSPAESTLARSSAWVHVFVVLFHCSASVFLCRALYFLWQFALVLRFPGVSRLVFLCNGSFLGLFSLIYAWPCGCQIRPAQESSETAVRGCSQSFHASLTSAQRLSHPALSRRVKRFAYVC